MAGKDYYQVLGVDRKASADEIKKAFRRLARQYHPDMKPDDAVAEQKFKEVNEAYEVLGDAGKRREYDTYGEAFHHAGGGAGAGPRYGARGGVDFEDLFRGRGAAGGFGGRAGGDDFSHLFSDLFGGGFQTTAGPHRGRDIEYDVDIPFLDAVHGTEMRLQVDGRKIDVRIPAGTTPGTRLRLAGKGQPSPGGGPAGDLILRVGVQPHDTFSVKGHDLYCRVPVPVTVAMLGGQVDVPTLDGKVKLTIPPGTQPGQKFRLRGKGMKIPKTGKFGAEIVEVDIVVPRDLSPAARELVEQLAAYGM
ncbi:MAG: J domain-containing protein [Deltaproteobacteria bacterium]|nr:J domain-containing protein [Candidatus Anaeroferrophillacea bacterium]